VISILRDRLSNQSSRGLADAVSEAIRDGSLAPGDRLPSIRAVAGGLQLSPTTVSAAWSLLSRAGAIETDGRRGTRVATDDRGTPRRYRQAVDTRTRFTLDLATGVPDPALLPDLGPALRGLRMDRSRTSYLDDPVAPELADLLREQWPYVPELITVVDGAMDALDLIASTLLRFGDRVAVEDPCFPPLLDLMEAVGVRALGVAVDEQGMVASSLRAALATGVRAVVLQPRAQNPTGVSLSQGRADELAEALRDHGTLVIEDDSAGAIAESAAISLGSWIPDQTIHIRSFSKSHGPDLRLAAVSGRESLLAKVTERRLLGQGWTSRLLQSLLADLLTRPASVTAVERARAEYARRRAAIVADLGQAGLEVPAFDGINLWLPVADESAALVRLASRGIGAAAGRPFASSENPQPHLRITVGLIADHHAELAQELAAAARAGSWTGPR
jgi:DNA-binding transcriptional MocR family regulator